MADPQPSSRSKWLWVAIIAVLTALIIVWVFSPTGDRDADVDDPIATEGEFGVEDNATVEPEGEIPPPEPFAPGGDPE